MDLFYTYLRYLVQVLTFAIIARALLSWFPLPAANPITSFLNAITEPILAPLRRVVPRVGMLDITPLIAILLLQFLYRLLS
ncbi:MAG TPA: YggT family protein [Dehalococcoidia bacterium]|nr:YggT family protein [Dehalococcoidia bacterium]